MIYEEKVNRQPGGGPAACRGDERIKIHSSVTIDKFRIWKNCEDIMKD